MNENELKENFGKVWNTKQLMTDYEVKSFLAPYVFVKEKKTGINGIMHFQHMPRFYFNFQPE